MITRLDLPLGIGDSQAWEDYITRAHNPRFSKVSRQSTTRDLGKLFAERRDVFMKPMLLAASSVILVWLLIMLVLIGSCKKWLLVLG